MLFIPRNLKQDLKDTILRIPTDLRVWKRECTKIAKKKKKTEKDKQTYTEYNNLFRYYLGKWFAYTYVLFQLGEYKWVNDQYKKYKVEMLDIERGKVSFKL